ncbi:hypothetical protein ACFQFH_12060 [Halobaculum halobium]|uniref:RDD family protein n=1 Tax=Halobaculum halobium TaxID=3032281 RepID=A0ABD5TBD8_9EURY|nr:hypothetical protein [Halobaculum sp. SYNS20]
MVTVIDFLTRLLTSVVDLIVIFVTDVALRDPLSFVSFLFGAAFVGGASLALGYLALGALGYEFGIGNLAAQSQRERVRGQR